MMGQRLKQNLRGQIIVIPLNVPYNYPTDYIKQTASILSRRNRVITFDYNNPISLASLFRDRTLWRSLFESYRQLAAFPLPGITHVFVVGILPWQRISLIYRFNRTIGCIIFSLTLSFLSKKTPILWAFHPDAVYFLWLKLRQFVVYDVTDYYGEDVSNSKTVKHDQLLLKRAKWVFFNSFALRKRKLGLFPQLKKKSWSVVCGCDISRFDGLSRRPRKQPDKPRLGFIGHMDHRLDFKLLYYLVVNHPEWTFEFSGSLHETGDADAQKLVNKQIKYLGKFANVFLTGAIDKSQLAEKIQTFSVCLIPYDTQYEHVRYANPMKAYEYLALGKPVVATDILPLSEIGSPVIRLTDNRKMFEKYIKDYLFNWSVRLAAQARLVAQKHSWDNKIAQIEKVVLTRSGIFNEKVA